MRLTQLCSDYLNTALPDMTAFCRRLIQTPSVNGEHHELAMAELLAAEANRLGLHAELVSEQPRRPNIIISTATRGPIGLLLVGHLDTVPPGDPAQWRYPPFAGHIADGKIFGRGAIDTKGGMTAALYALAALAHVDGALPHGRVQFIGVPNEESGATGELGINFLRAQNRLHGQGAIYAYGGEDLILGHRGLVRYRITVTGKATHTGMAGYQNYAVGQNAVTALADLLLRLEQVDIPFSHQKYFDQYRGVITPGTVISGGTAVNIVPDRAEALLDARTIPEFGRAKLETLLNETIDAVQTVRPGVKFHLQLLNHLPPAMSDDTAPLFAIVEQVTQTIRGHTPPRAVAGPANEGYLFIEHGIPMVCGFGPRGANAHAVDEYVEIDSLPETALIYSLIAHQLSKYAV